MIEEAIKAAQNAGADYVTYTNFAARTFVRAKDGGLVAACNNSGDDFVIAGMAARGVSLFDYDAGHFVCGSAGQVMANA